MTDSVTLSLLVPEMILIASATLIFIVGAFTALRGGAVWLAIGALLLAAAALYWQDDRLGLFEGDFVSGLSGPLTVDVFGHTIRWGILGVGVILALLTGGARDSSQSAETVASLLLMLAGLMLIAAGNELILLFAGLELVSIPTYIMLYIGRSDARGQEAASKYFFLSILSSGVLLYGFSLLYGVGGSTRLNDIAAALASTSAQASAGGLSTTLMPLALLFVFAGLAFRLTAVPFHFYAPDVYQGTSHANAGLLATLPKIAGLAALVRIVIVSMPGWESLGWKVMLVASVLTMTVGNVLALWQTNVRRLLAYSSVAHAGYILIGIAVALAARTGAITGASANQTLATFDGLGASTFYLAVYIAATLGAFAALVYLSDGEREIDTLDDLAGLNRSHPIVALLIATFMFSLAGIPPLAGFWGKFTLLFGALTLDARAGEGGASLRPWFVGLAIVAVLNAAISAAYYLRVIAAMYFRSSEGKNVVAQRGHAPALAMAVCLVAVLGIGFFPGRVIETANHAGRSISEAKGSRTLSTEQSAMTVRH